MPRQNSGAGPGKPLPKPCASLTDDRSMHQIIRPVRLQTTEKQRTERRRESSKRRRSPVEPRSGVPSVRSADRPTVRLRPRHPTARRSARARDRPRPCAATGCASTLHVLRRGESGRVRRRPGADGKRTGSKMNSERIAFARCARKIPTPPTFETGPARPSGLQTLRLCRRPAPRRRRGGRAKEPAKSGALAERMAVPPCPISDSRPGRPATGGAVP